MTTKDGERKIKAIQKAFLYWVEEHPGLIILEPNAFNDLRRKIFRSTFDAYRLGILGLNGECREATALWQHFFGWFENYPALREVDAETVREVTEECFKVALEAFRVGAIVSVDKENEIFD